MEVPQIRELEKVLLTKSKIVNYSATRLTAPGENYGSVMLALDVQLADGPLQIVAKMVPPNEFLQKLFKTDTTFPNEIEFYRTILPTFQAFQRENGQEPLECFPKYCGGRINLDGSKKLDENAVLLLENLKLSGFTSCDQTLGFDYETAKLILQDLAKFHAVCVGLKLRKPKIFEAKIKPLFQEFETFEFPKKFKTNFISSIEETMKQDAELVGRIERVKEILNKYERNTKNLKERQREPFCTIIHTDFWVNNTMLQFVNNKPMRNKMIDFQLYEYGSPAKDLIFFLYSSVQSAVIEKYYDNLVEIYYSAFIKCLKEVHCDTRAFSFEKLEEEMKIEALENEFLHCLFMLKPIFAVRENVKELNEYSEEAMLPEVTGKGKEKTIFVIKEFFKREWLT